MYHINTVMCLIKVNSDTIKLTVHLSCWCVSACSVLFYFYQKCLILQSCNLFKTAGHILPDALLMLVLFFDSSSSLESNPESGRSHSEPLCRWPPGTDVTAAADVTAVVMDWFRENVFCSSTSLVFFSSIIQSAKWWSSVAPFAASSFGSRKGVLEWVT